MAGPHLQVKGDEASHIYRGEVQLKPHQIIDAIWMLDMEQGPLKGSLLANNVGTGKTFTYLALVHMAAMQLERRADMGEEVEFLPTLIIVPNNIISQVYTEATPRP
jgi:hypothetical protein